MSRVRVIVREGNPEFAISEAEALAYKDNPGRRIEWEDWLSQQELRLDKPFVPCELCGSAVDSAEGCMPIFDPDYPGGFYNTGTAVAIHMGEVWTEPAHHDQYEDQE